MFRFLPVQQERHLISTEKAMTYYGKRAGSRPEDVVTYDDAFIDVHPVKDERVRDALVAGLKPTLPKVCMIPYQSDRRRDGAGHCCV